MIKEILFSTLRGGLSSTPATTPKRHNKSNDKKKIMKKQQDDASCGVSSDQKRLLLCLVVYYLSRSGEDEATERWAPRMVSWKMRRDLSRSSLGGPEERRGRGGLLRVRVAVPSQV